MRVYVGNIPASASFEELHDLFSAHGTVTCISLKHGFAFIDLGGDGLDNVYNNLDGCEINGTLLKVQPCRDENRRSETSRVNFRNLPASASWQTLEDFVGSYGKVTRVEVNEVDGNKNGTVFFENPEEAKRCVENLNDADFSGNRISAYLALDNRGRPRGPPSPRRPPPGGYYPPPAGYPGEFGGGYDRDFPLKLLVPSKMVGAIIGKGGATIKDITSGTGAKIDVQRREGINATERVVNIHSATLEGIESAYRAISAKLEEDAQASGVQSEDGNSRIPLKILVGNELVGHLIGKGGVHIKGLMADSNTTITISPVESSPYQLQSCVLVLGSLENCCVAQKLIYQKLHHVVQSHSVPVVTPPPPPSGMYASAPFPPPGMPAGGYMNEWEKPMGFPPGPRYGAPQPMGPPIVDRVERVVVYVPDSLVGSIIGRGGANIKDIMHQSGAQVRVLKLPDDEPHSQDDVGDIERQIIVTGHSDAQFKAQQLIYHKLQEAAMATANMGFGGHLEPTLKVDISVPSALVGRIIGKGGARIKEIHRLSGAMLKVVNPPENSDSTDSIITITGTFHQNQAGQGMIRSITTEYRA
eukprot:m.27419 g.27419  ORF g.27419 m.27419 type:complete len:585 (+) comp13946_c1_seq1:210-1964(+)